jgi:hypothetical protein
MNSSRIKTKRDKNNVLVRCVFKSVSRVYTEKGVQVMERMMSGRRVSWVVSRGKVFCRCRNA